MIVISTIEYDHDGSVFLNELPESDLDARPARVSRVATLDGGSVLVHSGVTDSDRKFSIEARTTEEVERNLGRIFGKYTVLNFASRSGFYTGSIELLNSVEGVFRLSFLVKNKLA